MGWLGIDGAIVIYAGFQLGRVLNHEFSVSWEERGHFVRDWAHVFPYTTVLQRPRGHHSLRIVACVYSVFPLA